MSTEEGAFYLGVEKMRKIDGVWWADTFVKDAEELQAMKDCKLGDNDILVATYPKAGTAWLQRILSLIKNEVDIQKTDELRLDENVKFLEFEKPPAILAEKEPRMIKTHFPYQHIPQIFREGKGKILYMARNPKDTSVSLYFFFKMLHQFKLDVPFDVYFERFIAGETPYGSWSEHLKTYWLHRHDDNILWLFYEDLQKDPEFYISEIASFIGEELSKEQVKTIAEASSFSSMKGNPATNYSVLGEQGFADLTKSNYMRKGKVGDWKNHYTPEMSKRIDDMIEREITPLGLKFCSE